MSEAKAGGAHLADRMCKNLERFGGAQGTGRTRFLLSLDEKASPYTLKGQGIFVCTESQPLGEKIKEIVLQPVDQLDV